MRIAGCILLYLLLMPNVCFTKLMDFPLDELYSQSQYIVIGRVISVSRPESPTKSGFIDIQKSIKGNLPSRLLRINIDKEWGCDTSSLIMGENLLLFAAHSPKRNCLRISNSGRGRMPISTHKGINYVTIYPEVKLPSKVRIIPGLDKRYPFIRRANLKDLLSHLKSIKNGDNTNTDKIVTTKSGVNSYGHYKTGVVTETLKSIKNREHSLKPKR